jgi:2-hydroxycyclohexanecarboxyl-CoA dehydrogenase
MPSSEASRLAGKVAIVTGSAGGIGAATAELFCAHGAKVIMCDRNDALLGQAVRGVRERLPHADVVEIAADVATYDEAERVVAEAARRFGALDVLVSNAAIRHYGPIEQTKTEDWHRLIDTNLLGTVNFARAAMSVLRRSGNGSIVIVASCYALIGRKEMPIYDATKAALISLARSLAFDGAPDNVRVNAVCPGPTLTPYTIGVAQMLGRTEQMMRSEPKSNALLARYAEPREIAYPILWLASDEASYVTGATLAVDGGTSIM